MQHQVTQLACYVSNCMLVKVPSTSFKKPYNNKGKITAFRVINTYDIGIKWLYAYKLSSSITYNNLNKRKLNNFHTAS